MLQNLDQIYHKRIKYQLQDQFLYRNIHQIPKIEKIVLNRGLGEASQNSKILNNNIKELMIITGQKPIITKSRKSIAGFKIRENLPIGIKVTLRKQKMYTFLHKLINLALPRIRDFRGISKNHFDGQGNYNLGIQEQLIFPEIEYDNIDKIRGLDISIVTSAKTDLEGFTLLKNFGMPFKS
uniref:Large ribosomal subunit protein uL5c n=1 Tax=Neogoniolithon spectabile TaxID=231755 RepID=A0A3G3MGR5_9FLOR|nr:ribosomal protein L5 [Neogoniolithon spectabile]AYR06025.1 ribosomal protein L5 [Neogoniolithon spectabile]